MRLYEIMKDLIKKDDYCSLDDLISKYDVSKRTIQNDISYLMRIAPRKGFHLHSKRGKGYLLEITNEQLLNDFLETLNDVVYFPTKERPRNILAFIAIQDGYISMDKIADTFQVSKTLIKNDMKDVEIIAKSYHLNLERRSHYGVKVASEDKYFKLYLTDEYLNQNIFIQTAINDIVEDFSKIETDLINQLDKKGLSINYNELLNVIEYLKVMVYWSKKHNEKADKRYIKEDDILQELSEKIVLSLQAIYQIEFTLKSIEELICVLSKNIRKSIENVATMNNLENDIIEFLKKTDETYKTSFLDDDTFKEMLIIHVNLLIDRLHDKISYKNALANKLSITNPVIFNIAIQFCDMLKEKYDVESTFDEIGFVAMHFAGHMEKEKQLKLQAYNRIGVVCSSGGGSAYMIKLQIKSLFPKADVQTFSFLQQDELLKYEPDLIFTVMPLSFEAHVPIIIIKELLDDEDLYRIKQILQYDNYDSYTLINDDPIYYSFFSKDFFKVIDGNNYNDLIYQMAMELENKGYGKKGYANLVLERESYVSTVYMNGICIPHPLETDALRNIISVAIVKHPFYWKNKEVKMIFMICIKREQIEVYRSITKKLYYLMKETNYSNRMIHARSFEEMLAIFKEMGGVNYE